MKIRLLLLPLAALLVALASCEPATPIEEARSEYFASVEGRDTDCTGWLDWCIDEGYPQADCEERNEYCVDGEWVGGDDEDDDPCSPAADAAYNDCIDQGGSQEDCREAAEAAYDDCVNE